MNIHLGNFLNKISLQGGVDLHSHSTASDGSDSPEEVFSLAKKNQLKFWSLADHDNNQGVLSLLDKHLCLADYIQKNNLSYDQVFESLYNKTDFSYPIIIPAIELNVEFDGENVHLLAYFSGRNIEKLNPFLEYQRNNRFLRNEKMISKLQELGIPAPKNLLEPSPEIPVPGRVTTAKWLVEHSYASSVQDAFDTFLADGKAAYIPRQKNQITDALLEIEKADGFPVIAHPHQYGWCQSEDLLTSKIEKLLNLSPLGVEVFHSGASLEEKNLLLSLIQRKNLNLTAGSDYHGTNKDGHELYLASHSPSNYYR